MRSGNFGVVVSVEPWKSISIMLPCRVTTLRILLSALFLCGVSLWTSADEHEEQLNDYLSERLGVLLDISPEMGHLIPQVRKEIAFLNEELKKAERSPVVLMEMEGSMIGRPGALDAPASKNAVVKLEALFNTPRVNGVLWITSMKSLSDSSGFPSLETVLNKEPAIGDKPRQLMIHHIWPESIRSGYGWRRGGGDANIDPLHPTAYPGEWLKPVADSKGYVFRKWRKLPPFYASLAALPESPHWQQDLNERYALHFIQKREKWPHLPEYGKFLISNTTLIPFLDEETVGDRHEKVYSELCQRRALEDDLSLIKAERLGVFMGMGYVPTDLNLAKTSSRPEREFGVAAIRGIDQAADEFRANREANSDNPKRFYESLMLGVKRVDSARAEVQAKTFSLAAAKLIRDHDLDAMYMITNGFTNGKNYSGFNMSLEPLASVLKESGTRLYVRVPFELGFAPYEMQQLAAATGGAVFFGPGSEIDPDFKVAFPKGRWPDKP